MRLLVVGVLAVASVVGVAVAADEPAEVDVQALLTASLEQYLSALARTPIHTGSTDEPQAPGLAGLEVALSPESPFGADGYATWLAQIRPDHASVEYRVAALQISRLEDAPRVYETRFALERHTVDHEGLSHIARWQQRWRIRVEPGAKPLVISIDQSPRLAFPGTGPQIVCF